MTYSFSLRFFNFVSCELCWNPCCKKPFDASLIFLVCFRGDRRQKVLRCLEISLPLSLLVYLCGVFLLFFLLRQVSVMRCGACGESAGSLLTAKFLKVRRNRKIGNPAARARRLGQVGSLKCLNMKRRWASLTSMLVLHQLLFRL